MTADPLDEDVPVPPASACACRRCGRGLTPGRGELYVVAALAVADPYPPVFTEADLAEDVGAEIRRLVRELSGVDAGAARDQVYRRLVFHLCASCYGRWLEDPAGSSAGAP